MLSSPSLHTCDDDFAVGIATAQLARPLEFVSFGVDLDTCVSTIITAAP
jgi:hypothetical protein